MFLVLEILLRSSITPVALGSVQFETVSHIRRLLYSSQMPSRLHS